MAAYRQTLKRLTSANTASTWYVGTIVEALARWSPVLLSPLIGYPNLCQFRTSLTHAELLSYVLQYR
jgi:hypothetical protein